MFVYNSQYNKRNYPQNHIPQGYSPAVMLWVNSFITTHTNTDLLNAVEASVWTHPIRKPQGSPSKVQRVIKDVISLLFCAKKISHKSKKIWIQSWWYTLIWNAFILIKISCQESLGSRYRMKRRRKLSWEKGNLLQVQHLKVDLNCNIATQSGFEACLYVLLPLTVMFKDMPILYSWKSLLTSTCYKLSE